MSSGSHPGRRSGVDRFLARTDGPLVARSSAAGRSVDAIFATRNAPADRPDHGTGSVRAAAVPEVRPSGDLQGALAAAVCSGPTADVGTRAKSHVRGHAPERRLSDLRSSPRGYQAPEPGGAWLPLSERSSLRARLCSRQRCSSCLKATAPLRVAAWSAPGFEDT